MGWLSKILAGPVVAIGEIYKRRMELKAEERSQEREIRKAITERKLELIKQGLTADMSWEMEFARQAESSWKDEYTLIVVSIPLVMAFVPGLSEYVKMGFAAFAATPLWYQIMVQSIFYATYGMRLWRRNQSDT